MFYVLTLKSSLGKAYKYKVPNDSSPPDLDNGILDTQKVRSLETGGAKKETSQMNQDLSKVWRCLGIYAYVCIWELLDKFGFSRSKILKSL